MPIGLEISIDRGATIVRVSGLADTSAVAAQRDVLGVIANDVPFVVADLERATIESADAVTQLVALLGGSRHVHLVARRHALVSQLAQWRVHHTIDVHASVADAIATYHAMRTM